MNTEAKKGIENLVNKYKAILAQGKVKSYNEAQTRNEFIEPLFEYLGWDMRNLRNENEVMTEETTSKGRIDLAFRLNNIPVMFLEAKALKADLDDWRWAEQAINYSWNKGVTWAVLTDFESIKVFNAEIPPKGISDNLFFELSQQDYINKFDQLWLLSRESFKQGLLIQEAQKWGKITKRKQVGEKLFEDLTAWRSLLSKGFAKKNRLEQDELDEGVQRVLDRLIFIRAAEDRDIEPNILLSLLRSWESERHKGKLYHSLAKIFRQFDDGYNSKIFAVHYSEEWSIDDGVVGEVIKGLYSTEDGYRYDFAAISADVLGGIYEQYLGHVLKQAKKSARVTETHKKRKSQGIYYTPHYIVDYIVKETLGEVLKTSKPKDISKIKVLDPACGSGSFLTAAYDEILNYYEKHSAKQTLFTKFDILKENIYGVDLDAQAVEITQLNLLLKTLSQRAKLPTLQHNIGIGNSLVFGNEESLNRYFGKEWLSQKPFNFQGEFGEVFKQSGFDVIIGNPPYVVLGKNHDAIGYFKQTYKVSHGGKVNLYKLFIERSMGLLKDGGYLGFICPSNYLSSTDSKELRKLILKETTIKEIIEYSEKDKVFSGVTQALTTIILQKKAPHGNEVSLKTKKHMTLNVNQKEFLKNKAFEFIPRDSVIKKMSGCKNHLSDIIEGFQGEINVSTKKKFFTNKKQDGYLPLLRGNNVSNYLMLQYPDEFCPIKIDKRGHFKNERIVFQEVSNQQQKRRIKAVLVSPNYLCGHTTNYCFLKAKKDNLYVLALLNSKAINYFFSYFNNTNHVPIGEIRNIPIPNASEIEQEKIAKQTQQMLDLNKRLQVISLNTDQFNNIKQEIENLDRKIDEEVYKLYGFNKEEITIIESWRV